MVATKPPVLAEWSRHVRLVFFTVGGIHFVVTKASLLRYSGGPRDRENASLIMEVGGQNSQSGDLSQRMSSEGPHTTSDVRAIYNPWTERRTPNSLEPALTLLRIWFS